MTSLSTTPDVALSFENSFLDKFAKHLDSTILVDPRVEKLAFKKEDLIGNDEDILYACPGQGFTKTSRISNESIYQ